MPLNSEYSVKTLQSKLARVVSVLPPPKVSDRASAYVHEQQNPCESLRRAQTGSLHYWCCFHQTTSRMCFLRFCPAAEANNPAMQSCLPNHSNISVRNAVCRALRPLPRPRVARRRAIWHYSTDLIVCVQERPS